MIVITATKASFSQIRLAFEGEAAHVNVARQHFESSASAYRDVDGESLVVDVNHDLLRACERIVLIDRVEGEPFIPLFLPAF